MKKNIKFILVAIMAMMVGFSKAGNVTMPAGWYYFTFADKRENSNLYTAEIFNDIHNGTRTDEGGSMSYDMLTLDDDRECNVGVSQNSGTKKQFYTSGSDTLKTLAIYIEYAFTIDDGNNFLQVRGGAASGSQGNFTGWRKYSAPTDLGSGNYVCHVTNEGYTWETSSSSNKIPSCYGQTVSIRLRYTAASHGEVTESTGTIPSGSEVSEGTSVTLTATPSSEAYVFAYWTDANSDIVSHSAIYTFKMPASNYSLTAHFTAAGSDPTISGCADCFLVAP